METPELSTIIADLQDTSKSSYQRARLFETFLDHPEHLSQLSAVGSLLADENRSLRNDVVRALVRKGVPEYFDLLGTALDDEDDYVIREALRGLVSCTRPDIISKVKVLAETATYSLKADAERALKAMEDAIAEETSPAPESDEDVDTGSSADPVPEVEPLAQPEGPELAEPEKEPVAEPREVTDAKDLPPPLPAVAEGGHSDAPPPLPAEQPPPLPPKKSPSKSPRRPERPPASEVKRETVSRSKRKAEVRKDVERQKSSCGPVACGCLILAVVGILLAIILMFTLRSANQAPSQPSIEMMEFNAPITPSR